MSQEGKQRLALDEINDLLARPALSVAEFASIFDLDNKTAYAAVRRREIPSIAIGRRRLIPSAWVREKLTGGQS